MARIGVDFGGVLTVTTTPPPGGDEAFLRIPPRDGAKIALVNLRSAGNELFLVSKANSRPKEEKARRWLAHHGFDRIFGEDNLQFCRTPAGKAVLCRMFGIDIIIDDTAPQLELLQQTVVTRILFGAESAPEDIIAAPTWSAAELIIRELDEI